MPVLVEQDISNRLEGVRTGYTSSSDISSYGDISFDLDPFKPLLAPNSAVSDKTESHASKKFYAETYAIELGRERELVQLFGESYWQDFRDNIKYYIDEVYGKVRFKKYHHEILTNEQGDVELWFTRAGRKERARDSYEIQIKDLTLPKWCRERAVRDVLWVDSIEELLQNAENGDVFAEFSPAPLEVDEEERAKWGYGNFSFLRLHELTHEKGKQRLSSIAIRQYLALEEQCQLFEVLTGETITSDKLHGSTSQIRGKYGLGMIQKLIDELYQNTPDERKIKIPEKDLAQKTEEEMDQYFADLENWLKGIFYLLGDESIPEDEIEAQFRACEMTVKALVYGEDVDLGFIKSINPKSFYNKTVRNAKFIKDRMSVEYNPDVGSCPTGAGFRKSAKWRSVKHTENGVCVEIKCPVCGWKPNERQLVEIEEERLTCCPVCGYKP